jgi:hypothetical protein
LIFHKVKFAPRVPMRWSLPLCLSHVVSYNFDLPELKKMPRHFASRSASPHL